MSVSKRRGCSFKSKDFCRQIETKNIRQKPTNKLPKPNQTQNKVAKRAETDLFFTLQTHTAPGMLRWKTRNEMCPLKGQFGREPSQYGASLTLINRANVMRGGSLGVSWRGGRKRSVGRSLSAIPGLIRPMKAAKCRRKEGRVKGWWWRRRSVSLVAKTGGSSSTVGMDPPEPPKGGVGCHQRRGAYKIGGILAFLRRDQRAPWERKPKNLLVVLPYVEAEEPELTYRIGLV